MCILDPIYNAYCEGKFTLYMPEPTLTDNARLTELENKLGLSAQQIEELESVFYEIYTDTEKRGFYAGFKLALRLVAE